MSEFEKELGWDDVIEKESDFTLLPAGDYDFTITGFERARNEGSEKLPPCNKAVVSIHIDAPEGSTTICFCTASVRVCFRHSLSA